MLDNLLKSLEGVRYPIIVVVNHKGHDRYELGALKLLSKIDDVFLLQDSTEVKDLKVFDIAVTSLGGVALCHNFMSYIGLWKKSILDQMIIPGVGTKQESINREVSFTRRYMDLDPHFKHLEPRLMDGEVFEERFGRKNMILENEFVKKYKGTWQ